MDPSTALPTTVSIQVPPDWVDSYGHMNMARYVMAFDTHGYPLQDSLGVGATYTANQRLGLFVVDIRVSYRRELVLGDEFVITLRVLEADHIRLLTMLEMRRTDTGEVAATMEQLAVNASLEARRARPFEPALARRLADHAAQHRSVPLPAGFRQLLTCGQRAAPAV